jgi:HK97 family phage major capsid protein
MSATSQAEIELLHQLRKDWRDAFDEGIAIRDKKGYVDSEARDKCQKIDKDMNNLVDTIIAGQGKRIDDLEGKVRGIAERSSRAPGMAGLGLPESKSVGQQFVESESFKVAVNNKFGGKFSITATFKARFRPDQTKAATTIVEGPPLTITPGSVGAYPIFPYRVGLIPQPFPRPVMRDVVPVIPLDGTNAVEYVRETWTSPLADYQVLEGDKKLQTGVTYTDYVAAVRTIANYVKLSKQMAMDVPIIMASIEQKLSLGITLKEDHEILYGDNAAGHLWGIMPQATKEATFWTPPGTGNTFNSLDELNIAATHIENLFYFPNAIILNPTDEAKLEMMKTSFGSYVLGDRSPYQDGVMRLWGLPVVTTPNMNVGDFLVGAFPGNCALFDRETITVEIAFQNEDDFVRNLVTIRGEERVAFAVFVPTAFVCGPFSCPPCAGGGPFTAAILPGAGEPPVIGGAETPHTITHGSVQPATTPTKHANEAKK